MFELSQVRCFVAVAEELHFGRAAGRLNMTQPPLSRQVQLLEHSLGAQLLVRTSRVVKLTPAGRTFLAEARRMLRIAENAQTSARRVAQGNAGTVAIGFTAGAGYAFLPKLIMRCREVLPEVDLVLKEMVSSDQLEALSSGQLDVGLMRPPIQRPEFQARCVLREPLVAAVASNHALARKSRVKLADFAGQPFVMYSPHEARFFYDVVAATFNQAGVAPRYVQYMSQIHSILALVKSGLGSAIVPEAAASLHFDGVTLRPLSPKETRPVELFVAWRSRNDNPVLPRFLDLASLISKRA